MSNVYWIKSLLLDASLYKDWTKVSPLVAMCSVGVLLRTDEEYKIIKRKIRIKKLKKILNEV